jgi:nanoRNase/pAp phosphatase (c-di-AMP/oligoRNAs hydrolase)
MTTPLQRLLGLPFGRGPLLVLTHDNPDPDSVASAAAMRHLLHETKGVECTVAFSGIIGRAENRAMVELLDLRLVHMSGIDLEDFPMIALVDAQPHTGNSALPDERMPDIVIDHHPLRESTRNAPFYDVREELGASATLLTEYIRDAGLAFPPDLATALLYGIRSETHDLGREVAEEDLAAYQFLFPLADPAKLAAISRPKLPRRYYLELAIALDSLLIGDQVAICSLGEVIHPDFVPEMADLAVRMEQIEWSLAFGSYENRLYVSIRTDDATGAAGEMMQSVLDGIGRGGGHGMRAGGQVDLQSVTSRREELEAELRRRFLEATRTAPGSLRRIDEGEP